MNHKTFCLDDRLSGQTTSVKSIGKFFDTHMIEVPSTRRTSKMNLMGGRDMPSNKKAQMTMLKSELEKLEVVNSDLEITVEDLPWLLAYNEMVK